MYLQQLTCKSRLARMLRRYHLRTYAVVTLEDASRVPFLLDAEQFLEVLTPVPVRVHACVAISMYPMKTHASWKVSYANLCCQSVFHDEGALRKVAVRCSFIQRLHLIPASRRDNDRHDRVLEAFLLMLVALARGEPMLPPTSARSWTPALARPSAHSFRMSTV